MRRAGKLLCILTQHSLEGSDAGREAEALERALHTLPATSRLGTSGIRVAVVIFW
jgi:hypothetical protein